MLWFSNKPGRLSSLQEGSKKELDNFHLKPSLFSSNTHINILDLHKAKQRQFYNSNKLVSFLYFLPFSSRPPETLFLHNTHSLISFMMPSSRDPKQMFRFFGKFHKYREREISIISIFLSFACKRRTFANNECFFHFAQSMHELWIFCLFKMILSFRSSLSIFVTKSLTRRYDDQNEVCLLSLMISNLE